MKRKLLHAIPFLVFALFFCVATLLIHFNSDKLFIFFENTGAFREEIECTAVDEQAISLEKHALTELLQDERVIFDQSLMLVNTEFRLSEDFIPAVAEYKSTDVYMNACMLESYASLSAAVSEKFDVKLYVSSDFRTAEEQSILYAEDPLTATLPGASEHQTGLAVDVYVPYFAGDGFIKSPAGRFVNAECYEYGFIIRYPSYGEEITGIRFEPWHIRYVGQPHAEIIYRNRLTLEEYVLSMEIGQWYIVEEYMICRQAITPDGELMLPASFEHCVISPDNTGCYIVTVK